MNYVDKRALVAAINNTARLFIAEFDGIADEDKDRAMVGVDRTPAQMIAYQLGWLKLVKSWDDTEVAGGCAMLPAAGYRWNQLGELYQTFYKTYDSRSLTTLIQLFTQEINIWNQWLETLSEATLFIKDNRNWTKPYPANWTVAKFIHINSVAPFKSFRTQIRKWKKIYAQAGN